MWYSGQIFNFVHEINFTGFVTAEHTQLCGLRKCFRNTWLTALAEICLFSHSSDNLKKIINFFFFFLRGKTELPIVVMNCLFKRSKYLHCKAEDAYRIKNANNNRRNI